MQLIIAISIFSACLGAYLFYIILKFNLRRKLKVRFTKAFEGEVRAEEILAREGYSLESKQMTHLLSMWINGEQFSYRVRPDAFASKEGKQYLVEVKTGKIATDPRSSATRRQLLEYFHGFSVDGVLLIDAESKKIHNIHFEKRELSQTVLGSSQAQTKQVKWVYAFIGGMLFALGVRYLWR